jgi:hypothetical protein
VSDTRPLSRDRTAAPAAGLYNICYVNAFQVQPGEQGQWASDPLLRDTDGNLVVDEEWDECGDHVDALGNNVIVIEYTDVGLDDACSGFADTLTIVQRDVDVSVPGDSGYVRKTC